MPKRRTKTKQIKLIYRKLGRDKAYGMAYPAEKVIELDPRLNSKFALSVLVHEALHIVFPEMSERKVNRAAPKIAKVLWGAHYRWVDTTA